MSDAINPKGILNANGVYIPDLFEDIIDALVIKAENDVCYYLIALQGGDSRGGDLFVLHRQEVALEEIPEGGIWKPVEKRKTELLTVYKYREAGCYKEFQGFQSATLFSGYEEILISRESDEFGVEKMRLIVRRMV